MLLQRVSEAEVVIGSRRVAHINNGLLAFVAFRPSDSDTVGSKLVTRVLNYRIFADDSGKMNLNLRQVDGDLLLVPQFTLAADTRHGLRPGFSSAAPPAQGLQLFAALVAAARGQYASVASGVFGADMQVSLINDGPVTFWLES